MAEDGLGTNVVVQIGIVVRDIAASAKRYSAIFGMAEPEIIVTDAYDRARTTYMGQPTQARARLAFFKMGQVSLELIEPIGGPSTWQRVLDEKGEGVHHIAFQVKDTEQVIRFLSSHDIDVEQQGHYTGGMYTYVDSTPQLGLVLELLENFER